MRFKFEVVYYIRGLIGVLIKYKIYIINEIQCIKIGDIQIHVNLIDILLYEIEKSSLLW